MSDTPLTWDLNESIIVDLFVTNPDTGGSLTGQVPYLTLTIQRASDSKYWTGLAWAGLTSLVFTEVDSVNQPGRYIYTLPAIANAQADRYTMHATINNPPVIGPVDTYELHVSRLLDVQVYDLAPVDA